MIRAALSKNCVLFFGPGLSLGPDYLAAYQKFAEQLAAEVGWTTPEVAFKDVAQYYAAQIQGPDQLAQRFVKFVQSLLQPDTSTLDAIASLPFDRIVTTAPDESLKKLMIVRGGP